MRSTSRRGYASISSASPPAKRCGQASPASPITITTATLTEPSTALLCVELTASGHMVSGLRRGARLAPRVLGVDGTGVRACLVPTQAGPLAGDHDRVTLGVGAGATLIVAAVGAACALAGSARTLLELDVELGAGARLVFEEAPLILACGANVARSTTVRLAAGAVAALRDVVVLGDEGHGGAGVRLVSSLRVADARGALLHDALRIDPALVHGDAHVALAPGHRVVGTLSLFGLRPPDDDPDALALARQGMLRRATAPGLAAVHAELARTWAQWSRAVTTPA